MGGRNVARAANNVKEYRFVKDYPSFSGVKSSQSGKRSHCSELPALAVASQAVHSAHSGRTPVQVAAPGVAPRG
jgi:hypothetical protein